MHGTDSRGEGRRGERDVRRQSGGRKYGRKKENPRCTEGGGIEKEARSVERAGRREKERDRMQEEGRRDSEARERDVHRK